MRLFEYGLYAAVIFGWSTSWWPLSLQVGVVAPEVSLVWRFSAAALLMFLLAWMTGTRLILPWAIHLRMAALGVSLFSCNFAMYYYASQYAASGLLAVMLSMASVINIMLVAVLTRRRPAKLQLVAAIVGVCGLAIIFWPELMVSPTAGLAVMFSMAGTLLFCTGNMLSAQLQKAGVPVLSATSWGMFYGTLVMGVVSLVRGHDFIIDPSVTYLGSLAWLIVISSVLTFYCYLNLIGRIGAGRASYATVVFPIFALIISSSFEGYDWTVFSFAGVALVIAGNLIMNKARD